MAHVTRALQRLTQAWTPSSGDCAAAPSTGTLGGSAPYWTEWTHDVTGNRVTETDHASAGDMVSTLTYPNPGSLRPHAVTSATTVGPTGTTTADAYDYDESGNTLTRTKAGTTQTFTYDVEGHVATAKDAAGKESSYLYDANGNRLITRDATGTTLFVGDTELFVATGTTTKTGTRYYMIGGQQVAVRTSAGLTWKVADHQGTSTASIKATDLSVSRRYQDPYGNTRGTPPSSWPDKRAFIGGYQDTTSLVHIGAREYDPSIGRFTSVDPILDPADPQSWNGYAYAGNNPVDHSDPTGEYCDGCNSTYPNGPQVGVNCPPCSSSQPPASSPKNDHYCDGCNNGAGWATPHGNYPGKVGSHGKPVLDLSRVARPPLLRDLQRHFYENNGEWYPLEGEEYLLDPIPGYVPPEELSEGTRWLILGGVVVGVACLIVEPCGAIAAGLIEATGPPMAVVPSGAFAGVKGIGIIDDALGAAAKEANAAAKEASAAANAAKNCVGNNSFAPGTRVLMADGSTKAIDKVEPGDLVLATDPVTGETGAREVVATIVGQGRKDLVDVTLDTDGARGEQTGKIIATAKHPFRVAERGWVEAANLHISDGLATQHADADAVTVLAVTTRSQYARVYNLTVADLHTYYVLAGATPVLVHNSPCDHIAIGLQDVDGNPMALDEFGMETGGATYSQWPGNGPWYKKLNAFLSSGSKTRISFNLDGISDPVASAAAGKSVDPSGFEGLTNWSSTG